jgi:hypothetical protein
MNVKKIIKYKCQCWKHKLNILRILPSTNQKKVCNKTHTPISRKAPDTTLKLFKVAMMKTNQLKTYHLQKNINTMSYHLLSVSNINNILYK